ncbi:AGAP009282-PA-like protein [Anopheles sinensis]|uniref:AGAP009282-PA-like protein n=1 Tax=Anopheles sinensis TaxID=74873 RepID=A0A084VWH5_ANOSI|nr:AGAP009282-PA-like protein [Anopheles sinensis]
MKILRPSERYWAVLAFICLTGAISLVQSQIPGFGTCPDYSPILRFNRTRFLGTWYEIERYFTVTEVATKCVSVTYEQRADGKIYVRNAYTNRFNGVERIISGVMDKGGKTPKDGRYQIEYTSFPYNYNASVMVLDTDYDSFAVLYSCSSFGPVGHAVSAWLMARERLPAGPVLQRAYGVLDKYKISRTFFLRTNQEDCVTLAPPEPAIDPTEPSTQDARNEGVVVRNEDDLQQLRSDIFAGAPVPLEVPSVPVVESNP